MAHSGPGVCASGAEVPDRIACSDGADPRRPAAGSSTTAGGLSPPVLRPRIVLLSDERLPVLEVACQSGVGRPTVWRWQQRSAEEGLDGLLRDKTRPSGKFATPQDEVQAVLERTLTGEPPGEATHWTGRAMAALSGLSLTRVQRPRCSGSGARTTSSPGAYAPSSARPIRMSSSSSTTWWGSTWHRRATRSCCLSTRRTDPGARSHAAGTAAQARQVRDLHPRRCPATAPRRCSRRRTRWRAQCSAVARHATGLGSSSPSSTRLRTPRPAGQVIHTVMDNDATPKHPEVVAWLADNPRWTFHFMPTSCSWLDAVESFFSKLTRQTLHRRPHRHHRPLHREHQPRSQTFPVDRLSRQHHGKVQAEPTEWLRALTFYASSGLKVTCIGSTEQRFSAGLKRHPISRVNMLVGYEHIMLGNSPAFRTGWGGRVRTSEWRNQNPLPYHLATPHRDRGSMSHGRSDSDHRRSPQHGQAPSGAAPGRSPRVDGLERGCGPSEGGVSRDGFRCFEPSMSRPSPCSPPFVGSRRRTARPARRLARGVSVAGSPARDALRRAVPRGRRRRGQALG